MSREEAIVAVVAIVLGCLTAITVVGAIAWATVKGKKQASLPDDAMDRIESRMERIELAIDSIAVEVERVSEGQRFVTRLLGEAQPERLEQRNG
jgi:hypothetical protein